MHNTIYSRTPISNDVYSARGLLSHNHIDNRFVKLNTGVLVCVTKDGLSSQNIVIKSSIDNGFTWTDRLRFTIDSDTALQELVGYNSNGPCLFLIVNETVKFLQLYYAYYNVTLERFEIRQRSFTYEYSAGDINLEAIVDPSPIAQQPALAYLDSLVFDMKYNDTNYNITFTADSTIYFYTHNVRNPSGPNFYFAETSPEEDNFFDLISTYLNKNLNLDVLAIQDFGSTYSISYIAVDIGSGAVSAPVEITNFPVATVADVNIARDGWGNLCAYWVQFNAAGTAISINYSISKNNGVTWTTPESIPYTSGQGDHVDLPTGQKTGRAVLLEGNSGWILGYVRSFENKTNAYIRLLNSPDGENYTLENQRLAASHSTKDINGFRFFKISEDELYNLASPGEIRIAYQIGQGNNQLNKDSISSTFAQKLLSDEAFPDVEDSSYSLDIAVANQLLFNFNLLGSTESNVDYYAEGLTGIVTEKYLSAFSRHGTSAKILQYEPIQEFRTNDRNSYNLVKEVFVKSFLDDIAYANPFTTGNENFETYIERDTRQIHLPPDFHLSRTYLINDGGHHQRTVWLMRYADNEYELTQVVPKFIDNQIAYYTANAYVIGSTRDPFTRIIQPTET